MVVGLLKTEKAFKRSRGQVFISSKAVDVQQQAHTCTTPASTRDICRWRRPGWWDRRTGCDGRFRDATPTSRSHRDDASCDVRDRPNRRPLGSCKRTRLVNHQEAGKDTKPFPNQRTEAL